MKILILCLSFCAWTVARAALPVDADVNRDYWNKLDEKSKSAFLTGYRIASFHGVSRHLYPEQMAKLIPLIDALYKAHPDPNLLVQSVIEISLMQLDGRPPEEIDVAIRQAERAWK
jgi:hypothetical protein